MTGHHLILTPGLVTTGLWCNDCALPSGISCPVLSDGTSVGTYMTCTDCDGHHVIAVSASGPGL